jgi:hypothetical protein
MNANKRPLAVTFIGCLYVLVGVLGFAFHLREFLARHAFHIDVIEIEVTELVALFAGIYVLRGHNWARFLAVAWILFHVILSAFEPDRGLLVHSVICILIIWALFNPAANRYFRQQPATPPPTSPDS